MSIQNYIGWSTGVNRVILDTSTPTFGENALRNDELESGGKRSIQKRAYVPDVFAVTMEFDWVNEVILHKYDQDGNIIPNQDIHTGKTEFQLFVDWYKYEHKYGTVPFEFPKILYSQNTGIDIFDDNDIGSEFRYGNDNVEFYKITNAVQGSKSGERVQVQMTWETVFSGDVSISVTTPVCEKIEATKKYVDIYFSLVSETAPVSSQFTVYADNVELEKTGFYFDEEKIVRIHYPEVVIGSVVTIAINNYSGLNEAQGTHISTVQS